ncbi:hypothetical protein H5407_09200 [Mitsuaria sp. WAJ17]|uniref:hypothetical protein n=1 Tax=Mitsuaria sp. WAJ17 TaxID=2761452 RepID=UPI0015FFFEC3|nr:hypothetical protein [Mitsuaria sp. WAJ17]MBB2485402.1 hypothetical protein [Mitsuaria sp. WAJ17]
MDLAKTAFIALAGIGSIAAFAGMIKGSIDATAALHDLSIQTGASVAALGAFKSVGSYTETSAESIAGAMNKLAKNMAMADEDSKGAAVAIKALGLNFDDFKKLKPEDQMLVAAKAMGQFEDGADKTAAAMLLFGKEGAKLLPFLKDLGDEADTISAKLTDQEKALKANQAAMADAFGDNLTKIRKDSDAWKKDIATGMIPALYEASQAFVDVANGAGGVKEYISKLAKDGTITEWARMGVTAITYIADAFQVTWRILETIGKSIGLFFARLATEIEAVGDAAKLAATGDFSGAVDTLKRGFKQSEQMAVDFREETLKAFSESTWGSKMRDRMAELKGVALTGSEAKDKLGNLKDIVDQTKASQEAAAKAAKEHEAELKKQQQAAEAAAKAGADLIATLDKKRTALKLELDLGRKLSDAEKEQIDLDDKLKNGKIVLDPLMRAYAQQLVDQNRQLELSVRWQEESRKQNEQAAETLSKQTESLAQQIEKQKESNQAAGKSSEQLAKLEIASLQELAVARERIAALMDEVDWSGKTGDEYRKQAEQLRKLADLKAEGIHLKAAQESAEEWKKTTDSIYSGLTDALMRAFESGQGFADAFKSTLINAFKTMVLQPVIKAIIQPVGDSIGSIFGAGGSGGGGLFGGMGGTGGGGFGGMGNLGGLGSVLGSFGSGFSGGWQLGNAGLSSGWDAFSSGWTGLVEGNGVSSSLGQMFGSGANMLGTVGGYFNAFNAAKDGKWGSAIGSGVGTFFGGPVGGAIGSAVGGFVDKAFGGDGHDFHGADYVATSTGGYRPREYEVGDRQYGWSITGARSDDLEKALKGVSDVSLASLNGLSKLFGGTDNYKLGTYFSSNETTRNSQGNIRLWQGGSVLSELSSQRYATDPKKGFEEYSQDVVAAVKSAMQAIQLPEWARKQIDALGTGATVEQLAKTVQAIEQTKAALLGMGSAFAPLGGVFAKIGSLSDDAKLQLAGFAGGIDALIAKTRSYVDSYYSDGEKNAISAASIKKQLDAAGITANLGSKEDFRALVDSLGDKLDTEAGRKQLAALLDLNQAFAPIGEYLKQQGITLNDLAAQAPQVAALQSMSEQQASSQQAQLDATQQLNSSVVSIGEQISNGLIRLGATLVERLGAVEAAVNSNAKYIGDSLLEATA